MLKAKLLAALLHGSITLAVALITALVVFFIWFPGALAQLSRGTGLFLLVLGVEVVLGPVMSLVIYNTRKPRIELLRDYCVIGVIQLAALVYGIHSVTLSRPVYLVFVKDRIEVVAAGELAQEDLDAATVRFRSLSWTGPQLVCTASPKDAEEKANLITSAMNGKDIHLLPRYYRDCLDGEIMGKAHSRAEWESKPLVRQVDLPPELQNVEFVWLPIVSRFGIWTVFYPNGTTEQPVYLNVDSF